MTDLLPDKVVDIDLLRINRNIDKRCKCDSKGFIVDHQNRMVYCSKCGAQIEPYEALYYLANHYEDLRRQVEALLEQRKQIANYKPHMVVFRELEREYRGKKMLPCCPHCNRGFYFEEISSWVNTEFEKRRREREGVGSDRNIRQELHDTKD